MNEDRLADALDSMTRRDLEQLQERIARRLVACILCGADGADPLKITGTGANKGKVASVMLCKPCFEKHRLPESRAEG